MHGVLGVIQTDLDLDSLLAQKRPGRLLANVYEKNGPDCSPELGRPELGRGYSCSCIIRFFDCHSWVDVVGFEKASLGLRAKFIWQGSAKASDLLE